jgi:hypothetical protein
MKIAETNTALCYPGHIRGFNWSPVSIHGSEANVIPDNKKDVRRTFWCNRLDKRCPVRLGVSDINGYFSLP